jgi:Arylamine N-acetyltransferase
LALDVRDAYLTRLGVQPEPPSAAGLALLAQRQVERVPYETLWIQGGEHWDIDPAEAARRIATQSRGGYCYHLNGALGLLLASLGYSVHAHVGGVHGPDGPTDAERGNHLVLTVDGLPTDDNPGGVWYVDAGLGDALHSPLPLVAGTYDCPPFGLSLEEVTAGSSWHLTHDPSGGFGGMSWTIDTARLTDFETQHRWLSTSPESGFVKVAMAERRDAGGVDVVRGLVRSRIGSGAFVADPMTRRDEWFELLADLFGLRFDDSDPGVCDRLWATVLDGHRRWEAEQG